jgi:hypothetical protein
VALTSESTLASTAVCSPKVNFGLHEHLQGAGVEQPIPRDALREVGDHDEALLHRG